MDFLDSRNDHISRFVISMLIITDGLNHENAIKILKIEGKNRIEEETCKCEIEGIHF